MGQTDWLHAVDEKERNCDVVNIISRGNVETIL